MAVGISIQFLHKCLHFNLFLFHYIQSSHNCLCFKPISVLYNAKRSYNIMRKDLIIPCWRISSYTLQNQASHYKFANIFLINLWQFALIFLGILWHFSVLFMTFYDITELLSDQQSAEFKKWKAFFSKWNAHWRHYHARVWQQKEPWRYTS